MLNRPVGHDVPPLDVRPVAASRRQRPVAAARDKFPQRCSVEFDTDLGGHEVNDVSDPLHYCGWIARTDRCQLVRVKGASELVAQHDDLEVLGAA